MNTHVIQDRIAAVAIEQQGADTPPRQIYRGIVNPRLRSTWNRENAITLMEALTWRTLKSQTGRVVSHRTESRALGYVRGWDDCQHAILAEVVEIIGAYVAEASRDAEAIAAATELSRKIEDAIRAHVAMTREDIS